MKKTVLTNFLFYSGLCFILAQKVDFRLYTVADGLPSNAIYSATQDSQGFIWLNAGKRLSRFDGTQFWSHANSMHPVFKPNRGAIPDFVVDGAHLYFADDSKIFILNTLTGKEKSISALDKLPGNTKLTPGVCRPLANGEIAAIFSNTESTKLFVFLLKDGTITHQFELTDVNTGKDNFFLTLCSDGGDNLYFLSRDFRSVLKYNKHGQKIKKYEFQVSINSFYINRLRTGQEGSILFSDYNRVFKLNKDTDSFQPHPANNLLNLGSNPIYDLLETPEGNLWVCGIDNVLFFYDARLNRVFNYQEELKNLVENKAAFTRMFFDDSGTLWVTCDVGLLKVMSHPNLFDTYFTEPNLVCGGVCSFRGFTEDEEGNIYASFYNNIFKIDQNFNSEYSPFLSIENEPYDLYYYENKLLQNSGLIYDLSQKKLLNQYPFPDIRKIDNGVFATDNEGRIWLAYYHQLFQLELSTDRMLSWDPIGSIPGDGLAADLSFDTYNNLLWYGAEGDLWTINPATYEQKRYGEQEAEILASLKCIYPDGKGSLWLGTEKGLLYFNYETNSWKRFTQANGLPNDIVAGILPEGDSCLWLSTYHGLSRFHIQNEQCLNFYQQDGLADNEFNRASHFKASDGRFYFGGIKGVTAFYPEKVIAKYANQLSGQKLLLRSVSMTEDGSNTLTTHLFHDPRQGLEIYHHNRTLNIEFGVLSNKGGETFYSYILDGHDANWSVAGKNNSVMYSSLPAGDYVFRVKALDARGNWLPEEIAMPLIVQPPWWETNLAYFIYCLILAGIGYTIYSFLKRRWELQSQLQLEHQEALRLKELDSFKSRLFTNLTHEFRTPLTVLLGMTEELSADSRQMEVNETEKRKLENGLDIIQRNGKNLLQLVNRLLDLSKLENKTFQLQLQNENIIPYLSYLTESYHAYANSRNVSLRFFTTLKNLEMDFDAEQIQQILSNLLSNAIKFTPSGGEIKVEVGVDSKQLAVPATGETSTDQVNQNANYLSLVIKDTGTGIHASDLPHIFDRFYQVDGSTTRKGEGTGIGLAHTLELVKLMGGIINVESELNKGTTFTVSLPISNNAPKTVNTIPNISSLVLESIAPDSDLQYPEEKASDAVKEAATATQLLIIEDNHDVVAYLKTILSKDYEILTAYNGRIGIEMALERIPDLIISDVMMPEKDGYQVCDFLKNNELTSHIPIVLLTAKADVNSKITGLKGGADAYIPKPFNKAELLATLGMMLENRQRISTFLSKKYALAKVETATERITALPILQDISQNDLKIEDAFLQKVQLVLEENYSDENFALPQLCQKMSTSRFQLFRKLKALTNESPANFIRNFRLQKARHLLETTNHSIKEVGFMVGYKDIPHFSRTYQEVFGIPPSATNK